MKPYQITLITGLSLIILGLWGYLGSDTPSFTSLIPVAAGTILMLLIMPVKNANKVAAHIAVGLTFIMLVALIKPLTASIARDDTGALIRVLVMMLACILSMSVYFNSFRTARKQRSTLG